MFRKHDGQTELNLKFGGPSIVKTSLGISTLFLFAFTCLMLSCTKTTVAPTQQVSSSTKHLDRHINAVLKREGIQPSKMSEDAEFLRRVHLDLTGKIPTPEEVLDFLKDGSSGKRQRKIRELLANQ